MPAPLLYPEVDVNGTNQPVDPAGIPQATKDDGFLEIQVVPNTWWNWVFKNIYDWIVYLELEGVAPFAAEHDTSTGVHTDVTADSVDSKAAIYAESDTWGTDLRLGGPVAVEPGGSFSGLTESDFIAVTVPADVVTANESTIRAQGGMKVTAAGASTSFVLRFYIGAVVVASHTFVTPVLDDQLWGEIDYVFDAAGVNLHFVARFHEYLASGASRSSLSSGTVAFSETIANSFKLSGQMTGAGTPTYDSHAMSFDIYQRG